MTNQVGRNFVFLRAAFVIPFEDDAVAVDLNNGADKVASSSSHAVAWRKFTHNADCRLVNTAWSMAVTA